MKEYKFEHLHKNNNFSFVISHTKESYISEYLKMELAKEHAQYIIDKISKSNLEVLIVGDLFIDSKDRNKGYGKLLFKKIFEQPFDIAFMVCDDFADNNFNLIEWYKSFGFEILIDSTNPFMVIDNTDKGFFI